LHAHAALKQASLDKVAAEAQFVQGGPAAAGARRLSAEHRSHTERAEKHLGTVQSHSHRLRDSSEMAVNNTNMLRPMGNHSSKPGRKSNFGSSIRDIFFETLLRDSWKSPLHSLLKLI
jgi:hypothetical protein